MIAILPVSNIVTATGVILAERTLVLPSAGAMIVLGACVGYLTAAGWSGPRLRRVVLASVSVLAVAATLRSMERSRVWRSSERFFDQLVIDGPTTYRAQLVASVYYLGAGRLDDAEATARRGLELYKEDPQLFEHLGQLLRRQRRCREAMPVLAEGVRRFPERTVVRSRLIECNLQLGDTARALGLAEEAVRLGYSEFKLTTRRLSSRASP
jgi:Tfp pilus assembly protein PilF